MDFFTTCNGIPIRVSDQGKGDVILLLHGYLETLEVWETFAASLAKTYRVITPDLPGHGLSGWNGGVHTMEFMADTLKQLLDKLDVASCVVVGHSMGGYVALAFAKKYNSYVKGLCLFHSTPNPDTEEKKLNRDREAELIRADKLSLVLKEAIPRMFAEGNTTLLQESVWGIEEAAEVAEKDGIIACLMGMKEREDMNAFLASYSKPLLLIFGKNDRHIPFEQARAMVEKFPQAKSVMLEQSGHIGFIEEPEGSLSAIRDFMRSANAQSIS